jgi:hypothetical protein
LGYLVDAIQAHYHTQVLMVIYVLCLLAYVDSLPLRLGRLMLWFREGTELGIAGPPVLSVLACLGWVLSVVWPTAGPLLTDAVVVDRGGEAFATCGPVVGPAPLSGVPALGGLLRFSAAPSGVGVSACLGVAECASVDLGPPVLWGAHASQRRSNRVGRRGRGRVKCIRLGV